MTDEGAKGTDDSGEDPATDSGDENRGQPRASPVEAFSLLGNETRVAIVRALWAAGEPCSFTDLRRATDVADTGQFNYHLRKLLGHYVRRSGDGGETYELTSAGEFVVGAIVAEALDQRPTYGTVDFDGTCIECGGGLAARFEDVGTVFCPDCGRTYVTDSFPPPGTVDRTPTEMTRAFDRWVHYRSRLAREGVCPRCAGRIDVRIHVGEDDQAAEDGDGSDPHPVAAGVRTEHVCTNCRHMEGMPLFWHAVDHPAVVGFFWDHGIDLHSLSYWSARPYFEAAETVVESEDPFHARVTFRVDDHELAVEIDADLRATVEE